MPFVLCMSECRRFDVILERVPATEKPDSPRSILRSLTNGGQDSVPAILLKPNPTMNAHEFERLWKSLDTT